MMNRAGRLLCLALIIPAALPTSASAAEPERLFGCDVAQTASNFISLYATPQDDGAWSDVHFLLERDGVIKASVLERSGADPRIFYFSNSDGPEGYLAQIRFSEGGRNYLLALLDIPPDPAEEADMGGRIGALTVTEADGTSSDLHCGEIDEYIGLMQEAMACDMTNPYGAAGCDFGMRPMRTDEDALPLSLQ